MPSNLLRTDPGLPDGFDVLLDVDRVLGLPDDDPLAMVLWHSVRRVLSWAGASVTERAGMGGEGRLIQEYLAAPEGGVPELAAAVDAFVDLWACPAEVDPAVIAGACDQVGRWAADGGLMPTAMMFMEVAAAADPENALRAMDAGLMCQRLGGAGMMQRAEQWHQRAFGLARVAKHGRKLLSIRALLAYGNWAVEAGDYSLARKCYERAARRAWRYERWSYYAAAHHNLLYLAFITGESLAVAEAHAETALHHYSADHARLPVLAHDYAVVLNHHRLFSHAYALLENLPPLIQQPELRLLAYSSLALAAAGTGRRESFERAVTSATPLLPLYPDFAGNALTRIAEASLQFRSIERATEYVDSAIAIAASRGDEEVLSVATHLRERIQTEEPAVRLAEVPAPSRVEQLSRRLRSKLTNTRRVK